MHNRLFTGINNVTDYISVPPYLYRYEDDIFIDQFFETGQLMISCFKQYKSYKDNELGDSSEGLTANFGFTENQKTIVTVTGVGFNTYCFCTSTLLDSNIKTAFKRNSVFRIKDPINFMIEIGRTIPRVTNGLSGNCIYLNNKMIKRHIPAIEINDFKTAGDENISFEKMMSATEPMHGPEQFFIKKMSYQHQCEYRMLWNTDREVNDKLVLNCPEAVKYCERLTEEDFLIG